MGPIRFGGMRAKGPKCKFCGKTVQLLSFDTAYIKIVKSGEVKAGFICWKCAEAKLGEKLGELAA